MYMEQIMACSIALFLLQLRTWQNSKKTGVYSILLYVQEVVFFLGGGVTFLYLHLWPIWHNVQAAWFGFVNEKDM